MRGGGIEQTFAPLSFSYILNPCHHSLLTPQCPHRLCYNIPAGMELLDACY